MAADPVTPYVVRRPGAGSLLTVIVLAVAVVALPWWGPGPGPATWTFGVIVLVSAVGLWRDSVRFRAGPDGIRFASARRLRVEHARIPWSSVEEVLVVPALAGPPEVVIRLRPGAPLPDAVLGAIHEPGAIEGAIPDALRHAVPGLDADRLGAAVGHFAPGISFTAGAAYVPARR